MQHCKFCGLEFPHNARFCAHCGRAPDATLNAPTTLSSAQVRPVSKQEAEEEEERRRRAFLLDLPIFPGGAGQPVVGNAPMVQGTPQMSGAPMVQGAPSSLSGVSRVAGLPPSAVSGATGLSHSGAPAVSAVSASAAPPAPSPMRLPQAPQSAAPMAPTAPSAPPQQRGSLQSPPEHFHHERQEHHPSIKEQASRLGRSATRQGIRSAHRWLLIALSRPGTITTFSLPAASSAPSGITAGPDGALWFTENYGNKIGRITPGGTTTGFSTPLDLASDASGALTACLPGTFFAT